MTPTEARHACGLPERHGPHSWVTFTKRFDCSGYPDYAIAQPDSIEPPPRKADFSVVRFLGDPRGFRVSGDDIAGYMGRPQQVGAAAWVPARVGLTEREVKINLAVAYAIEPDFDAG